MKTGIGLVGRAGRCEFNISEPDEKPVRQCPVTSGLVVLGVTPVGRAALVGIGPFETMACGHHMYMAHDFLEETYGPVQIVEVIR